MLPPLVIGLSLLILFHLPVAGTNLEQFLQERLGLRVTYAKAGGRAGPVRRGLRVRRADHARYVRPDRHAAEQVALTLGCRRSQAFLQVALPQAWRGMIAALTIAWARSLGEFGPILVFAGATRMRTEVLSTTVFLELSVGQLEAAVAVSLLMVLAAMAVLGIVRLLGSEGELDDRARQRFDPLRLVRADDVNLSIREGAYAVLMGGTGQGKTTILEAICGLRP